MLASSARENLHVGSRDIHEGDLRLSEPGERSSEKSLKMTSRGANRLLAVCHNATRTAQVL